MKRLLSIIVLGLALSAQSAITYYAIPGEYIVRFKSAGAAQKFFANQNYSSLGAYSWIKTTAAPMAVIKTTTTYAAKQAVENIQSSPEVYYMEPNYLYTIPAGMNKMDKLINSQLDKPNDNRFDELWGLHNVGQLGGTKGIDINALNAWKLTKGHTQIKVAVIDTGIDYTHPDLKANIWTNPGEIAGNGIDDDKNGYVDDIHGWDFANHDNDPMDDNLHGTHCAGTIGAVHNNSEGVAGVMANVQLIALKFLTAHGSGSTAGAIEAIDYATKMGAHVMSNSWGGGGKSTAMYEAIARASQKGIVFVAAAGNSKSNNDVYPTYPASYALPNVIAVAAVDNQGKPASFSNFGKRTVHVAAPGVNILSTVPGGKYRSLSGTSMAAPHVSGVVGLALASAGTLSLSSMRDRLVDSSKAVPALDDISVSGGIVDARGAISK